MNREALFCGIYQVLLFVYPREFRGRFGAEMRQVFRDRCRAAARISGKPTLRFFFAMLKDWMVSAGTERIASMSATWNNRFWRAARGLALAMATLLICATASAPFLRAYVINSASMQKTMQIGDYLLVHRLSEGAVIHRDELISFHYPLDAKQIFLKRVIGLPGDHIRIIDKQVIRNGLRLVEPYSEHVTAYIDPFRDNFPSTPNMNLPEPGAEMLAHHVLNGEVVVPEGSFFVLGDNRDDSLDSRYWGFVPRADVVGRPLFVYWSWDAKAKETRWGRTLHGLHTPPPQEVKP